MAPANINNENNFQQMPTKTLKKELQDLINDYADVYQRFEDLQEEGDLSNGDQKTGVIAEFYAQCYIETNLKKDVTYADPGEPYDLKYTSSNGEIVKVQVKGVSGNSKSRTIAPLNLKDKPFDYLYLIDMDKCFKPVAFYINTFDEIKIYFKDDKRDRIVGTKMKELNSDYTTGSKCYNWSKNQKEDLLKAIE